MNPVGTPAQPRLSAIDILRGLVMVVMALDHTRDFFSGAHFDPTDLTRTTPALFFTRWITHFCAPVFVFLAGTGAYISFSRGKSPHELAKFLITRGLWLVFLEIAVVTPLGWSFSFDFSFVRLQVIWAIGVSMVALGLMIPWLSARAIGVAGLVMIAGHNLLDGVHAPAWKALHSVMFFQPFPHKIVASLYPLIPWAGVMAVGYGAGQFILNSLAARDKKLLWAGLSVILLFIVLRGTNAYGDPRPWTQQRDGLYSLLSVLNCTKYPPSLAYLLMTLGPALCLLSLADFVPRVITQPFAVFGRVPLFYYLLHLPLLHGLAVVFSAIQYGRVGWLLHDPMLPKASDPLPATYGYELWVVYVVWAAVVLVLCPACRWFAGYKREHRQVWLSYL